MRARPIDRPGGRPSDSTGLYPAGAEGPTADAETDEDADMLWRAIDAFEIGDGSASLGFADRLARENGWSGAFAGRVIAEYKRFLFLGQVAGHPVTPSDEVDQAWHLHLTYTRSYWDDLCENVLGRPFHHDPTVGGPAEGAKFDDWYARTLDSYRRWFGHDAPPDIWPDAAIRFGEAPHYVRVNTRRRWLVPKPSADRFVLARPALVAGSLFALAGCSSVGVVGLLAQADQSDGEGAAAWAALIGVLALAALIVWGLRRALSKTGSAPGQRRAEGFFGPSGCGDAGGGSGCGSSGCGGGGGGCGGGGCGS